MRGVGIFDSGLGGLCAVRELRRLLPEEDIVYFGDVARIPYGTRSRETVCRYAAQDAAFLVSKNVDAILVACGTVSSTALEELKTRLSVPVVGVVEPAAEEAVKASRNRKIGVLGTQGTIASGAYKRAITRLSPDAQVVSVACPLLVPIVENGETDGEIAHLALQNYLKAPLAAGCDTLLLGCTHYPLLKDKIASLAPGVALIDAGQAGANATARLLRENRLVYGTGKTELYTSDFSQGFSTLAQRFLQDDSIQFSKEKVNAEDWK